MGLPSATLTLRSSTPHFVSLKSVGNGSAKKSVGNDIFRVRGHTIRKLFVVRIIVFKNWQAEHSVSQNDIGRYCLSPVPASVGCKCSYITYRIGTCRQSCGAGAGAAGAGTFCQEPLEHFATSRSQSRQKWTAPAPKEMYLGKTNKQNKQT